jgi:hypothetical protein
MTIERLSLPDGVPMDPDPTVHALIGKALIEHAEDLSTLQPGEYDLTPEVWINNTHRHTLLVHPNWEGTYRMFAINPGSGLFELGAGGIVHGKRGGRAEQINAKNPLTAIAGGKQGASGLFLFEAIFYLSDEL